MRFILLFIISFTYCLSVEHKFSGSIDASYNINGNKNLGVIDANFNNDFVFENTKIGTSVGIFANDNKSFNNNTKKYVNEVEVYRINELYITQYLTDDFMVSVGIFPFKKGTFYEYGYNGNGAGIGLYTLTDGNLQGTIFTYKVNEDDVIQFGRVEYGKFFKTHVDRKEDGNSIGFDKYNGSGLDFISYKNTNDRIFTEYMVTNTYQYVDKIKLIDTNTYSLALSYDDEDRTGRTYYTILTLTNSEGDTSSLSPYGRFKNDTYHLDKFETKGYSFLLGVKQEIDNLFFDKDGMIGFEYLKRGDGYHSLLAGEPQNYDSYSNIGDIYNTYVGVRFNKDTLLKLRYYKYDTDRMTKLGLSPVTTDLQNKEGYGGFDSIILQLYIDF